MRILIADDHEIVRRGLRQLLEDQDGWQVCGEASTGRHAVDMAQELAPQVVNLEAAMPELNGIDAARLVRKERPSTQTLIFTMHQSEQLFRDALAAGVRGYLLKSDPVWHIVSAVKALAQGKPYFNLNVSSTLLDALLRGVEDEEGNLDPLTPREREVVQLLAEAKSNKQIAILLSISLKTVETHRAAIMRKIDAHSVVDIVRYAIRTA